MEAFFSALGRNPQNSIGIDYELPDAGEVIQISALALLKMLKHGN